MRNLLLLDINLLYWLIGILLILSMADYLFNRASFDYSFLRYLILRRILLRLIGKGNILIKLCSVAVSWEQGVKHATKLFHLQSPTAVIVIDSYLLDRYVLVHDWRLDLYRCSLFLLRHWQEINL